MTEAAGAPNDTAPGRTSRTDWPPPGNRRRRLAALLAAILLHLTIWFLLTRHRPAEPTSPPTRVLATILVPRPPPEVPPPPALHVELMQPIASAAMLPALDMHAPLPPVRRPARTRRSTPVVGRIPQPVVAPRAGAGTARAPGHGSAAGAGAGPCLPCVWQWEQRLVAQIQSVILYPRLSHQIDAVARVRLRMDRAGMLLSATLVESSGHAILDREALGAVRRAAPLPPAPRDVEGDPVELVVPIRFFPTQR